MLYLRRLREPFNNKEEEVDNERENCRTGKARYSFDSRGSATLNGSQERRIYQANPRGIFTVRLRCPGGMVETAKLSKAAELSQKYGCGEVHLSIRQSIEIPYVHYHHLGQLAQEARKVEWSVAYCGPRVRVPTACAGCS
jgi:dissimilatory sulfite reductase (desulfoviridin) alpha/beta subunit